MDSVLTKVTIPTPIFQSVVSRAAKGSTMIPLIPMSCLIQLKIKDNKFYAKTTDNSNYLTVFAEVDAPDFEAVVQTKLFSSLVSKLDSSKFVELSIENDNLVVKTETGKFNFALETEEGAPITFPEIVVNPTGQSRHLTTEELQSILTLNKACKQETKEIPALYNYYFENERVITTDTYKACINPISASDVPMVVSPVILDLTPSVANKDGVTVYYDDKYVVFESSDAILIGEKGVQEEIAQFPAASLVNTFTKSIDSSTKLIKTQFLQAVDRICLFSEAYENDKLSLVFKKDYVELHSKTTGSVESISYYEKGVLNTDNDIPLEVDAKKLKSMVAACDREEMVVKIESSIGIIIQCGNAILGTGTLD